MDHHGLEGTVVAGYRVDSFIARGGMAVVYRAHHLALERPVALKILAPELAQDERFRQRFVRESELAASLEHPNIVPVYEAGTSGDFLFIAMRLVDGADLRTILHREGPLPLDRALSVLSQIAGALDAAHEHGLVHRDVKPGNILVAPSGRSDRPDHAYLSDFGLTKRSDSLGGFTTTNQFVGTIDYIAPEQIRGDPAVPATDVYALGCVTFQALTGQPPFERDNDAAVIYAHLSMDPPSLVAARPDLPARVADVLSRALAKDPDDRYLTCRDMVVELRRAARRGAPGGAPPGAPGSPPPGADPWLPAVVDAPPAAPPSAAPARPRPPAGPAGPAAPAPPPAGARAVPGRPRRRRTAAAVALAVISALVAGGWFVGVRGGGRTSGRDVLLPFAREDYPVTGLQVSRSWRLRAAGEHLRDDVTIVATRPVHTTLYEGLPPPAAGTAVTAVPAAARTPAGSTVVTLPLDGPAGTTWHVVCDLQLPPGPASEERLQTLAVRALGDADTARARERSGPPRVVSAITLSRASLAVGGLGHRLLLGAYPGGRPAPADVLAGARFAMDTPRVVSIDDAGVVTPLHQGSVTVTARLGPLTTTAVIVVGS